MINFLKSIYNILIIYMSVCNNLFPLLVCPNASTKTHPMKNQKQYRISSSHYLDLKKSLTVIGPSGNIMRAQNQNEPTDNNKCVSNIGGPGDNTPALQTRGLVRAMRKNDNAGVDRKHGSYERYLARKRGWNIVQLECV
jgi:hypothetical protein